MAFGTVVVGSAHRATEAARRTLDSFDRTQPRMAAQLAGIETLPYGIPDPES